MIFYSSRPRYFLLIKITTRSPIKWLFIRDSAYIFTQFSRFNLSLIDNNQLIIVKADCIPSKSGMSPAFGKTSAYAIIPSRSITKEALLDTPFIP